MKALVVHPGTQHAFRLATELHRLDALAGLHTGFAIPANGWLEFTCAALPAAWQRRVSNRRIEEVPHSLVHLQPVRQALELAGAACNLNDQRVWHWRYERFQRAVPERALREADVVIGFDMSSWILTERCRALGKPLIMVQTTGHPDAMAKVVEQLAAQFPEWAPTWERWLPRVREAEQIEHDDTTLIVGSSRFTRQTLIDHGVAADKIRVLPHGVDCARYTVAGERGNRPFRFIFVGSIRLGKGVPLLLEAWRRLQPTGAELWMVGHIAPAVRKLLPELPGLRFFGKVPGVEVAGILQQCDVMVFPSYFEGFGLVILQAMACGLPVITTAATAGPDLIPSPGEGGWIVPTGDADRLTEAMEHCLAHQDEMPAIGKIARLIAERQSWQVYGRNWLPVLAEAVQRVATVAPGAPSTAGRSTARTIRRADVLVAHPGTQYSHYLAAELQRRNRLAAFHTGLAMTSGSFLGRCWEGLPAALQRSTLNRRLDAIPGTRLHFYPVGELIAAARLRWGGDDGEQVLRWRNARFQRLLPESALQAASSVVGFDTSSWILARRAKALGKRFILDQSIGHPAVKERVFAGLRERYPAWSLSVPHKAAAHLAEEREEHSLADVIVVPSDFVKETLLAEGVVAAKIRVIPFGTDLSMFHPATQLHAPGEVVFLFVGSLSARKGLPVLLEAWRSLTGLNAELWLVGPGAIPAGERASLPPSVKLLGPKSRPEVAALMRQADVFVFPSFFEGLAQVQVEALAAGLPVIATHEAGAGNLVQDGQNGYLVPAGDAPATARRIEEITRNPGLLGAMRQRVLAQREQLSWKIYGDRWAQLLDELT